jgi:hypothetical protein
MDYCILEAGEAWKLLEDQVEDIYFTQQYYHLNRLIQEGEARCFVFRDKEKSCHYPFLLRSIGDTGYFDIEGAYGYNGHSPAYMEPAFRQAFFTAFSDYCQSQHIIAEFTRFHPLLANHHFAEGYMDITVRQETVTVALQNGYEDVWNNAYSSRNRNMIRKAEKSGFTLRLAEKKEEYLAFGEMLRHHLRKKGSDPFYLWPEAYYAELFLLKEKYRHLWLAYHEGQLSGGAMFLSFGKTGHYHLAARSGPGLKAPVSNFLLDAGIRQAVERGLHQMHLGGGMSQAADDPLLLFKKGFSSQSRPFRIGSRVHNSKVYHQLVREWEKDHPGMAERYAHYFLRYRLR